MVTRAGWPRVLTVGCRTLHLVAGSALVGGMLWDVDAERLELSLWLAVASGLGPVALESQARPSCLIEGRGRGRSGSSTCSRSYPSRSLTKAPSGSAW
jgi:hypothetical protein